MNLRNSLSISPTLLVGYLAFRVMGSAYESQLNSVDINMSQLDFHISELQSVAQTNGHSDVHELCDGAKESLKQARLAWKNIAFSYNDQPWLASDSTYKGTVDDHWSACGTKLGSVFEHPKVLPANGANDSYSQPVQNCKVTYETCQSSLETVWKCSSPFPTPSGAHYKRQSKAKRDLKVSNSRECPAGETACPISAHSSGHECIDTQSELTSCGGCVSKNEGENCLNIQGAAGVGCHLGRCLVLSVQSSYFLGHDGRPKLRRRRF